MVVAVIQLAVHCCQQPVTKVLINHLLNWREGDDSRCGSDDSNQSIYLFSEFLTLECCAH